MRIVIIGCTMIGRKIARKLSSQDNDVTVIDNNIENIKKIRDSFDGRIIEGLEYDKEILELANVENCDSVIVCTKDDNINIMTAQMLNKIMNVNNIILCLQSVSMAKLYKDSIFKIICTTSVISDEIISNINNK